MLRALQRGQGDASLGNDTDGVKPDVQFYPPTQIERDQAPPSRLEQLYLRRSGEFLKQFGYDVLGQPSAVSISQSGAIADRYVLSSNDELVVTFRGQENSSYRVRVDRDGRVTLPKLNPILAAGRHFGDFRADLEAQVAQAFVSTRVYVTPGSLHQLSVLVAGEVRVPGSRIVSGLASPLDAILLSGGVKKTGSLRRVRVSGAWGSRTVDLYSVIAQVQSANLGGLRDGDTVYVPPISATAAVAGAVTHPGIYELPPAANGVSAATLLRLAGSVEIAGSYTLAKISVQANGGLSLLPATETALVRSGEVLVVLAGHGATTGRVSLRGAVASAGVYPLASNATVSDLFHSASDLSYDGYAPFALILRRDSVSNAVTIIPFSISGAIRRTQNLKLQSEDLVFVLTRAQVASMARLVTTNVNVAYTPANSPDARPQARPSVDQGLPPGVAPPRSPDDATPVTRESAVPPPRPAADASVRGGSNPAPPGADAVGTGAADPRYRNTGPIDNSGAEALAQAQALANRSGRDAGAQQQEAPSDSAVIEELAPLLHVTNDALLRTASDNLVWVLNTVREPGAYIGAPGSSVADMIQAAGGAQQTADLSSIEVTSTEFDQLRGTTRTVRANYTLRENQIAAISIHPLDVIRLRPIYSEREEGTVTVAGQVRYPGVFDIMRSERLSALLARAGGLSEVAYPYGAIFTRKDAAIAEKEGNERSASELENELPTLILTQGSQGQDLAAAGTYLASLARNLRQIPALGRIVITADPAVLAIKPELDFVLQPGDTLFIPKRPSTVIVSGEVLKPGAFQYRPGLEYSDYVRMAGGATQSADGSRTFIVFPDGSSAPIDSDWLSFSDGNVPPGSTIIVPRDLRPFNWAIFFKDVTQIASQLAVTAASLSILGKN